MGTEFKLGSRLIGSGYPPLVIAEVGINHEGSFEKAIKCVDAAVAAGAECVKFQSHISEAEMIETDMTPGDISDERLWDIIKRCELTADEEKRVKEYCEGKGIIYLCTPFSREAADRLNAMGVVGFKIGSGECNNLPLLDHIAKMGKPIILSTGMNDIASITKSVEVISRHNCPLVLLHCTSMYPTPYEKVRLGGIQDLQNTFGLPVGLSDHSIGVYTCLGAVALGACVLEKHFTVTRDWPGPDISISIEPDELAELVKGAKAIFEASGGSKTILPGEQPVIDFAYASVVSIADIKKGDMYSRENIWVKRPGDGPLRAEDFEELLGGIATRDVSADSQIQPGDIEGAS